MNCLHPEHKNRKASSRGICKSCYVVACRLVKSGAVTWQQLEKAGKVRGKKGNELEKYYGAPLQLAPSPRVLPVQKSPKLQKYPVGSLAIWDGQRVKVISFNTENGYELEYAETGDWAEDCVAESDLSPAN